jgi:tetratricopeptide (TPR) repeat protein
VDSRTDLFSLGIVLYEVLTGFRPFQVFESDGSPMAVAHKMWAERIQGPPDFPVGEIQVPFDLKAIITKCLQPNVADRYGSAADLIEDLERFLQSKPLRFARDAGLHERFWKWTRKHVWACVGTFLCVTVLLLLLAGDYGTLTYRLRRAERVVGELVGSETPSVDSLLNAEQSVLNCRSVIAYSNLQGRRARLLHDLGLLFLRDDQFERSIVYFQQAVKADPHLGEAYSNLGVVNYRLQRIDEALDAFDEAIRLGYNNAEVLANRGAARFIAGDISGATEDLKAAIRKNPDSPAAKQNLELLEKLRGNR